MNKINLQHPALWTIVGGLAIGAIGFSQFTKTSAPSAGPLMVQALPVRNPESPKLDVPMSLKAYDESIANLAEYALPSVVYIEASSPARASKTRSPFGGGQEGEAGAGSGVIIRSDGYILTNDHVVGGFDKVKVTLNDGRSFDGEVRRAKESDLAVVKINAKDLPSLAFADSNKVRPGQMAMAIGSPFQLVNSVSVGHVSALNRANMIPDARSGAIRRYTTLIQTDAAINRGNSGGPLINVSGDVVGINTTIFSLTGASNGIGFSIPSNEARIIAEQLIAGHDVKRAAVGIVPGNVPDYRKKELKVDSGALAVEVRSNGPAAEASLQKDDVIVRVGQTQINNEADLRNSMLQYAPGSSVDVEYVRHGDHKVAKVKLADSEALIKQEMASEGVQMPQQDDSQKGGNPEDELRKLFDNPDGAPGIPRENLRKLFGGPDKAQPRAEHKAGEPAKLGVSLLDVNDANRSTYHLPKDASGAIIRSVEDGSVADDLGLRAGDLITRIGDLKIHSAKELVDAMKSVKWGDSKRLEFYRYGENSVSSQSADVTFK